MTPEKLIALIRSRGPNHAADAVRASGDRGAKLIGRDNRYWVVALFDDEAMFFDHLEFPEVPPSIQVMHFELVGIKQALQQHHEFDAPLPKKETEHSLFERQADLQRHLDTSEIDVTPHLVARIACFGYDSGDRESLAATAAAGCDIPVDVLIPADWAPPNSAKR